MNFNDVHFECRKCYKTMTMKDLRKFIFENKIYQKRQLLFNKKQKIKNFVLLANNLTKKISDPPKAKEQHQLFV